MTMPARPTYLMNVYEKLGAPLLSAAIEAIERDNLMARQQGQTPPASSDTEEAERIATLLKSSAELGFALSRQIDLRMLDAAGADGVRLTLATLAAPLIANLYRVNARTPTSPEIDRIATAMQAVTLFADNYNAAADTSARMQTVDYDFAPADAAQIQLMILNALMPAVNAVCTFSFGQPEKNLLQSVMNRLTTTAKTIRADLFANLSEHDGLRAEISLLRAAAALYSQAHFTEMSKLMFLDESQRDTVNLADRLVDLWRVIDIRLSMIRVLAEGLVQSETGTITTKTTAPGKTTTPIPLDSPFMMPTTPPATTMKSAATPSQQVPTGGSPFSGFAAPKTSNVSGIETSSAGAIPPVAANKQTAAPVDKSNPLSMFGKPKEAVGGDT